MDVEPRGEVASRAKLSGFLGHLETHLRGGVERLVSGSAEALDYRVLLPDGIRCSAPSDGPPVVEELP
jgi:hypothetical protein